MHGTLIATASIPVLEAPEAGADLVTEVVVGERLEVIGDSDGWFRVFVPDHATRLDRRGYPGWIPSGHTTENPDWDPSLTVVEKNAADLPLGALLEVRNGTTFLPDGTAVEIADEALSPPGETHGRSPMEVAESLLGLPYRWGGTDSTTGMDCSGMVYRVMQITGIHVPRDADDQFDAAPFKSRESWKEARPGDLVFFGRESITHVGFYLGDGTYISEHGSTDATVRGMEEDPYHGFARYYGE